MKNKIAALAVSTGLIICFGCTKQYAMHAPHKDTDQAQRRNTHATQEGKSDLEAVSPVTLSGTAAGPAESVDSTFGQAQLGSLSARPLSPASAAPQRTRGAHKYKRRPIAPSPSPSVQTYDFAEDEISGNFEGRPDARYNHPTRTTQDRLSTFAVDVDTAAYSIARRSLLGNQNPNASLVRVEELINYFKYDYDAPSDRPFAIQFDGAQSPVDGSKHLLRIGIQSKRISKQDRLPSNIVFLIDTSCSMTSRDKLQLAKSSMRIAVENLTEKDQVAITTYAGGVSLVLPPTSATHTRKIFQAIETLAPSGGTAMASGMQVAYEQAALMLRPKTNTRVIVFSDGDANIGATRHKDMLKQIKGYVSEGVRMTTVGFGDGNYKDETMEQLANKGNGNYYYIDSPRMAKRVFGRDLTQMLQDVAQDVKIQVDFNPKAVRSYRLVGYENRKVADRDFRNDEVDAGEIGAGHQVTALYEMTLYENASDKDRLATVRIRSKKPLGTKAKETARRVEVGRVKLAFSASADDFRFATAVMGGSELLRLSPHAQAWNFDRVLAIVTDSVASDPDRREFVQLMKIAKRLRPARADHFSSRR
jgi:Ca-activated chloride channel homolog